MDNRHIRQLVVEAISASIKHGPVTYCLFNGQLCQFSFIAINFLHSRLNIIVIDFSNSIRSLRRGFILSTSTVNLDFSRSYQDTISSSY